MKNHGDNTEQRPPDLDRLVAAATLTAFEHRHEVVHLLYAAHDEADALGRIAALLNLNESTITSILDQPLRTLLPAQRADLESAARQPAATPSRPPAAATHRSQITTRAVYWKPRLTKKAAS